MGDPFLTYMSSLGFENPVIGDNLSLHKKQWDQHVVGLDKELIKIGKGNKANESSLPISQIDEKIQELLHWCRGDVDKERKELIAIIRYNVIASLQQEKVDIKEQEEILRKIEKLVPVLKLKR